MVSLFNLIIKISIYSLVFFLPLFWLPFSVEVYEFNKQYLIFFLVSLTFFVWLAKMVFLDKEIRFKRTPLDLLVVIFIFIAILSAIFSVDRISSFFGFYGRFSNSLIGLISLGILYFLITNNTQINGDKQKLSLGGFVKIFLWSVFFVILISYFSIFGVWQKLADQFGQIGLIRLIAQIQPIGVAGFLEGLAIFLVVVIVFLVGRILLATKGKLALVINYLLLLASLGLLIIIGFRGSWFVLLTSLFLFLVLAIGKRLFRENVDRLLLPIFLIILTIIFLFLELNLFNLPKEPVLTQKESWQVGFKGAIENIKSGFLGSGVGTFNYDFAKFKSPEFNQTSFWQIRFDRPGNYISEILGTMGFLGLISYLALVFVFFLVSWFILATERGKEILPFLMTFLAILVGQFFYYQNTVLAFLFWLFLGLSAVSWQKPISERVISFKNFPEISLIFSAFLIILGLLILGSYFFALKFYLADHYYLQALKENPIQNLEKATKFNPFQTHYKIVLARAYLNEILKELTKTQPDQTVLVQNTQKAIYYAQEASDFSPNLLLTWETLGMIYREIEGIVDGALEWGIKSFEKTISLEPANPVLYTELGKLYLASGDTSKAKDNFAKAISLKEDYIDAQIQEILILEKEGNLEEAISKTESLANSFPWNIEVAFQLGRLYFNKGRIDEAISQLERVVAFFPNHSNALYSLGVAYSAKGQKEKAIKAFEKVLELNPGNQEVIQRLEELKK